MTEPNIALVDLWIPWHWPARAVIASFAVIQLMFAGTAIAQAGSPLTNAFAVGSYVVALTLLVIPWGETLPPLTTFTVSALVLLICALEAPIGFTTAYRSNGWYIGASAMALMVLMFWQRAAIAWLTFASVCFMQILVSLHQGIGYDITVPTLLRHASTLLITWVVSLALGRVARLLTQTAERRRDREAANRVRHAIDGERRMQQEKLDIIAGSMLRRIAAGTPLTDVERNECRLVEATLRDTMSGRNWAQPDVLAAARQARERGVSVVLLDETETANNRADRAGRALIDILDQLEGGTCTARLLPAGRDHIASILVQDATGNGRVIDVSAH